MKILTNIKTISRTFAALAFGAIVLSACSKDDDDFTPPEIAGLNVVHASPTTEKLDVYVENTLVPNNTDFSFGGKIGYLNLITGNRTIIVKKKGTTANLLSEGFDFEVQKGYTLFVADKFDQLKYVMIKDDLSYPQSGKAKVRFVHMSPDAPALNLAIAGKDTDLFTNKTFKQYTEFVNIDPAQNITFNAEDKETGAVVATVANVKIEANKIYTIWVKGLAESDDDQLKLAVNVFAH
ncbi:DUF4397 domain-containing protein [Pedobacter deserti]|uniref:DUF4397 domain-containing protein n=1 Tax=Pedobacter deserti TaxID=2817382 RepID=UPI00210F12AE|nr:DUF4397 domain-containing protein [Pedobacter sp. SYSU D00382]